jgi:general secretion pathway protein G
MTIIELLLAITIVGILGALATGGYQNYRERVLVAQAVVDIGGLQPLITEYELNNRELPDSLDDIGSGSMRDPWGNPYKYVNHAAKASHGAWRQDKNTNPINSDYDLFSMGKDGSSHKQLTHKQSRDDIVRANDGRFLGIASDYDP